MVHGSPIASHIVLTFHLCLCRAELAGSGCNGFGNSVQAHTGGRRARYDHSRAGAELAVVRLLVGAPLALLVLALAHQLRDFGLQSRTFTIPHTR